MNQVEQGFCHHCRRLVDLEILSVNHDGQDHVFAAVKFHAPRCSGHSFRPAVLTFGPGWISWTVRMNDFDRLHLFVFQ